MSNSMFYTGLSGLNAAQAALVTTGHNTANVYTAGYSRQSVQISSAGGVYSPSVGFFGSGAKVTDVTRNYDQYLASQLNQAQSLNHSLNTYYTQISQVDNLLANQKTGLAVQMQSLFTGVQAVANTPADPAARQQLISSAQALANQFRSMDEYLVGLNASVNEQVTGTVEQINTYAQQIANLNKQVAMLSNASGGQAPNDLLDQRDQLVNELASRRAPSWWCRTAASTTSSSAMDKLWCWATKPTSWPRSIPPAIPAIPPLPRSMRQASPWSCRKVYFPAVRWAACCSSAVRHSRMHKTRWAALPLRWPTPSMPSRAWGWTSTALWATTFHPGQPGPHQQFAQPGQPGTDAVIQQYQRPDHQRL